jgi:uncharacterized membrane protein HdeD (DUF308 family)
MSLKSHSGALTAGLLLIALGVIFLAENFYTPFSAWRLIGRYWPVLLIIVGVKRLIEYFTWPAAHPTPDQAPKE